MVCPQGRCPGGRRDGEHVSCKNMLLWWPEPCRDPFVNCREEGGHAPPYREKVARSSAKKRRKKRVLFSLREFMDLAVFSLRMLSSKGGRSEHAEPHVAHSLAGTMIGPGGKPARMNAESWAAKGQGISPEAAYFYL